MIGLTRISNVLLENSWQTCRYGLEVRCWKSAEFAVIENGETLWLIKEEMQAHFAEAERLLKETGYHRRDVEIEELRKLSYEF